MVHPDFEETRKRVVEAFPNGYGFSTNPSPQVKYTYSIIAMPEGSFVIGRTPRVGSLLYDYIATTENRTMAERIVEGLNK